MSVVFPHSRKTLTRGKICGQVGLTALPPSDKKHPPPWLPPRLQRLSLRPTPQQNRLKTALFCPLWPLAVLGG